MELFFLMKWPLIACLTLPWLLVYLGGVLLTFSYLIVPAVCGSYLAHTLRARLLIGWAVATVVSLASLYLTPVLDLPIGATIVCALGLVLVLTAVLARFVPAGQTPKANASQVTAAPVAHERTG